MKDELSTVYETAEKVIIINNTVVITILVLIGAVMVLSGVLAIINYKHRTDIDKESEEAIKAIRNSQSKYMKAYRSSVSTVNFFIFIALLLLSRAKPLIASNTSIEMSREILTVAEDTAKLFSTINQERLSHENNKLANIECSDGLYVINLGDGIITNESEDKFLVSKDKFIRDIAIESLSFKAGVYTVNAPNETIESVRNKIESLIAEATQAQKDKEESAEDNAESTTEENNSENKE